MYLLYVFKLSRFVDRKFFFRAHVESATHPDDFDSRNFVAGIYGIHGIAISEIALRGRGVKMMTSQSSPAIDLDLQFELLADECRQLALRVLETRGTPLTMHDLATTVATQKYDAPLSEIASDDVVDIHIKFYHTHLPKFADAGVIDYDSSRERIEEADLDTLEPVFSAVPDGDNSPAPEPSL